ncbi:MAG: glycosyltransferase family 1 protein [Betaproteobacteria bacterium]|nr:MAG: glycosyltransferase family 1 protein [Betaproteobacteria bacterium]
MRIALVRQRYNPYGGAERFVERALAALERAGAEVTLITRRWNAAPGRRVLIVDPPYLGSLWRDAGFARAARAAWQRERFDLVQSHERIPGCAVYRAGDGVHRQWLEYRVAAASPLERLAIGANPYHRYVCEAERRLFAHPSLRAVICNSHLVRADIQRHFGLPQEKLPVIYNGVDLEHFRPAAATGERGGGARFLFVGSGFARKGLDTALHALALVPQAQLVVAGRDREAPRFAALARRLGVAGRVQLLGGVEDVRPLYAAADCFILPTLYDPFPNAALEALAMGVPIIVSRRCGAAELLREGENGWLCEPADAPGLAALMRRAAERAHDRDLKTAARASAEPYGIEAMARGLQQLYAGLVPGAAA